MPSIVTYPNFFGCPNASNLPKPSTSLTVPKEPSRRDRSAGVIAGVRPDMWSLFVIVSSAMVPGMVNEENAGAVDGFGR